MHVDSSIWFSPKIDKKILKKLSHRSDIPGFIHFLIYFSSLIFFGYLSYYFWGSWFFLLFFFIYSTIYTFAIANVMKQFIGQHLKLVGLTKYFVIYLFSNYTLNPLVLDGVIHSIILILFRQKVNMTMKLKFQGQHI